MRPPLSPQRSSLLARGGLILAGILLAALPLQAQEGEAEELGRATRTLKILPLGDSPPFRQEIRDGIRFELEPPAGSVPPRQIAYGEAAADSSVRLNLGRISEPVPIPGGALPFTLRLQTAPTEEPQPWLRVNLPELGNVLALVWRDPGTLWDRPRVLILPENPQAFPAGTLRLVNLTAAPIAVILGKERLPLAPGQVMVRRVEVATDVPVQLAYTDATGSVRRFHSSSVLLNEGERGQLFIHRADSEKPRQPVKVVTLNERVP